LDIVAYCRSLFAIRRQPVRGPWILLPISPRSALSQPRRARMSDWRVALGARQSIRQPAARTHRAWLLTTGRGIRTLFVRNLHFNAARSPAQRGRHARGLRSPCARCAPHRPAGQAWPPSQIAPIGNIDARRSSLRFLSVGRRPRLIPRPAEFRADPFEQWRRPCVHHRGGRRGRPGGRRLYVAGV